MYSFDNLSLLTDFYELTMMQGYFFKSPDEEAVFDMFYRQQPFKGGYTIFAGLAPLLKAIEKIKFTDDDIKYLDSVGIFRKEFLDYLADFSFKGDIFSVKEGSVVFPNEPLFRIHGILTEVQLLESIVLNQLNFQSLIATKTSRITCNASPAPVLEFGLRRAQGIDGSISGARAAYIGGVSSTSNTLAGKLFGIPVSGTMAHSWVSSFSSELESFEKYAELYPDKCVLLVDTFDTLKSGVPNAIRIFKKLKDKNPSIMAIRIDSGDLEYLSKKSRKIFDENGLEDVKIFVSNDIDEWIIEQLMNRKAPIDAWGIGTRLITGGNDPALTGVYKIVSKKKGNDFVPCIKISNQSEKITNPGIKNIMRFYNGNSLMAADLIYLQDEEEILMNMIKNNEPVRFNHPSSDYSGFVLSDYTGAEPLLQPVMKNGRISAALPSFKEIREFRLEQTHRLDETYKRLLNPHKYKVSLSDNLKTLKADLISDIQKGY